MISSKYLVYRCVICGLYGAGGRSMYCGELHPLARCAARALHHHADPQVRSAVAHPAGFSRAYVLNNLTGIALCHPLSQQLFVAHRTLQASDAASVPVPSDGVTIFAPTDTAFIQLLTGSGEALAMPGGPNVIILTQCQPGTGDQLIETSTALQCSSTPPDGRA